MYCKYVQSFVSSNKYNIDCECLYCTHQVCLSTCPARAYQDEFLDAKRVCEKCKQESKTDKTK